MKNERKDLGYELWKLEIEKQQRARKMILIVVTITFIINVINAIIIKNNMLSYTLLVINVAIIMQFLINIIAEIKCEKETNKLLEEEHKLIKEELNKICMDLLDVEDERNKN